MSAQTPESEFIRIRPQYEIFGTKLRGLILDLMTVKSIRYHIIESRVKTVESFLEKIHRPGKDYKNPLQELSDLCGIRIIVYYQDDVPLVGKLLTSEFQIHEQELSHSISEYSADRFGYLSDHYVVGLNENRCKLAEWAPYSDLKAEVQVRTVLQHSWATISHALQYKRENDVPHGLQRKLFRLAGIFELADEEFLTIRNAKIAAQKDASVAIKKGSFEIPIDPQTLKAFLENWNEFKSVCKYVASIGYVVEKESLSNEDNSELLGEITSWCKRLGMSTIAKLEENLPKNYKGYFKSIFQDGWRVNKAFILYLLLIRAFPHDFTVDKLVEEGWTKSIAERVIKSARHSE